MSTLHFWFRSGDYFLLGHLNAPEQARRRVGVVIVPPFGWEDVCSYRPLRFMAQTFASLGIPTLRYDLPGTGDSSGDAQNPGLFEAWIQSVADAATELRNSTGVEEVAAVGIHLGAMLALAAASRAGHLQQLVLWGAAGQGRAMIRELRAAANVERWEYADDAPPQPLPGFESGGFLMSPETLSALENLDVSRLPRLQSRRILLLSRDDLPQDAKLMDALQASTANVETAPGRGYAAMIAQPQEAAFPQETSRLIAEFIARDAPDTVGPRATEPRTSSIAARARRGYSESVYRIEKSGIEKSPGGMFGILASPATPRSDYCLLYLNAGGVRHTGPNRMWVQSARRWAARGVASLRLDLLGTGESDGPECLNIPALYQECLMEQIEAAIDSLKDAGMKRFMAIGLCSGACWAFHAAIRNPDVRAAILLNPSLLYWDPGQDRRRIVRLIAGGVTGWSDFARMVRQGIERGDVQRAAHRVAERLGRKRARPGVHLQLGFENLAQAWSTLERLKKRVALIFREGEALLNEMATEGQLPPDTNSLVRCIRVPNGGHTFRPLWAQKLMHELMDREIASATAASSNTTQPDDACVITASPHA